jgi:hypothetical protein
MFLTPVFQIPVNITNTINIMLVITYYALPHPSNTHILLQYQKETKCLRKKNSGMYTTRVVVFRDIIAIYAPMIYTAPCIMFWIRAYPLRGQVEGGGPWISRVFWAL